MEEMKLNREGYLISSTHRQCTNCRKVFEKTNKTVTLCPTCNSTRVKSQSVESKMYRRAKSRAKTRNLEFDIELSDIVVPLTCPILGIPLIMNSGKSGNFDNSPSIDRIDSSKGYIKGNIMVMSGLANCMKSSASEKNLLLFANWVIKTYTTVVQT